MKKDLRDKWIKALRSGNYKQAYYMLEQRDSANMNLGNCCLGVLCRVASIKPSNLGCDGSVEYDGSTGCLSNFLLGQFELNISQQAELMKLNDDERHTFAEIADYIETNL